jgi:RNA polymerase sigma-70 factor (ECF subfamily)
MTRAARTATNGADVDRDLVRLGQSGDREAFARLATDVSDRLFAVAQRILRDSDAAGDVLQTALVQIWRDLPGLRDPDRFEAWSYRIVVHCSHAYRRRARRSVVALELQPADAAIEDAETSIVRRDELERAFHRLTDDQRTVLVLIYYRDMTVTQVADVLGISSGTVKSRLFNARKAMRAAVEAQARPVTQEGRLA